MSQGIMDGASRKRPPNPFGDFAPSLNFYPSTSHRKVVHRVSRSLESSCGMVLLTGEIGIGKTSVSLFVQEEFSDRFAFVLLANPFLTPAERVDAMLEQLGAPADVPRTMDGLEAWAAKMFRDGRPPVLIIDECHLLQRESFSQLQVLSNLREGGSPLVQMLLVGQVEIADRLREPGMEAFNQRIGVRCEVEPMNLHDTREYVAFKLEKADYPSPEVFEKRAVERIWRISGGLPRLINHACSYALDQVTFCGLTRVTPRIVDGVVRDSMYRDLYEVRTKGGAAPWVRAAALAGLLACGAAGVAGVGHLAGWWGEAGAVVDRAVDTATGKDRAQVDAAQGDVPVAGGLAAESARAEAQAGTVAASGGGADAAPGEGGALPAQDALDIAGRHAEAQPPQASAAGGATAAPQAQFRVNDLFADEPDQGPYDGGEAVPGMEASVPSDAGGRGVLVPGTMPAAAAPAQSDVYVVVRPGSAVPAKRQPETAYAQPPAQGRAVQGYAPAHDISPYAAAAATGGQTVAAPGGGYPVQAPAQGRGWVSPAQATRAGAAPEGIVPGREGLPVAQPSAGYATVQQAGAVSGPLAAVGPGAVPEGMAEAASQGVVGGFRAAGGDAGSRVRDGGSHPVVGAVSVDAVAWADNDEARIAVLDGNVLREGGALPSGVVLLRIGSQDLLMEYQGAIYRVAWTSQPAETE